MMRYVITEEDFKEQKYYVSALYDEKRNMLEVTPEPVKNQTILGNIYIARVENVVKNLNAAFVKISSEQTCFLPLEDLKNPIFIKKLSAKKPLVAGDELLVQVVREALKTKDPTVTTNLSFSGQYTVLTTGNQKYSVSSKLPKDVRKHYKEMLERETKQQSDDICYGIIIRTNAAETSTEEILAEIDSLEKNMKQIIQAAKHKTSFVCLYQAPKSYLSNIKNLPKKDLEMILTDQWTIFEQLCAYYGCFDDESEQSRTFFEPKKERITKDGIILRYYQDEILSLSSLYSVKKKLEEALETRVWLKSGAYLIIEHTEALTVIDVNSGKNIASKDIQENFLKINQEAAIEIARQLRLRNISGIVLIDFVNLYSKEAEDELLHTLRIELKKDSVLAQVVDITKLGLVEVTRKKVKKSLREILLTKEATSNKIV